MLRAGLIGLGAMGRHHARLLRVSDAFEFVAAVDPDGDRHGALVETPLLASVDDLIERGVELAIVAVPTADHETIATVLAAADVHTLVEKPLADSTESATRVAERFATSTALGAVGHVERFNPALIELRRRLRENELGHVFSITTERVGPFPYRIQDVGVVKDLATHDIDIIMWLSKASIRMVSAQMAHQMGRNHEDLVTAVGKLSDGCVFRLDVNWLTPTKRRTVTVLGERGAFVADLLSADLTFYENAHVPTEWDAVARLSGVSEGDMVRYAIPKPEPLRKELETFAAMIAGDSGAEIATMEEGVEILRVAEAILRSAESGGTEHTG